MEFLRRLFRRKRNVRDTTDADINAILAPLGDHIADFKNRTGISWLVILPAVQKIATRLLVKERGLESTRRLYAAMLSNIDSVSNIPSSAILGVSSPSVRPDQLAEVNGMLWKFANDRIAKGVPAEHLAQALGAFAIMQAEKSVDGLYAAFLLKEAYREVLSDDFS